MIDNQKMSIILFGRIKEYFPETQTATVQISVETVYSSSVSVSETKARKPLEDVPVHTPSGGGWSLTMPIKEGDTCLLFFSQIGYDHWLYEDKDSAGKLAKLPKPWLKRQFSDDDGFALVGLNTLPRAIKNYSTDGSQWRSDDATQNIHLKDDLSIEINSPVSVTINAPSVVVNCETAKVAASESMTIDSPKTTITGTLDVTGATKLASTLDVAALASLNGLAVVGAGTATMAGGLSATDDITSGGTSVVNHTHLDAEGRPTQPPT